MQNAKSKMKNADLTSAVLILHSLLRILHFSLTSGCEAATKADSRNFQQTDDTII